MEAFEQPILRLLRQTDGVDPSSLNSQRRLLFPLSPSSRVSAIDNALMAGAANITAGSIMAQEMSQAKIQLNRKPPVCKRGKLATAAAMQLVNPD